MQVGIGGDVVAHLAIVELLIGHHVKVAGAGQAKDDGLFLAGLLALEGFVDGGADGAAQAAGGVRVLGQDLAAHVGGHAGAEGHKGTVGAHHLAAEGLLLIADLDHVRLAVQPEIAAGQEIKNAPVPKHIRALGQER